MRGFALASLVTLLLVPSALAESPPIEVPRRGDSIVIQGFSYGAGSPWTQAIAPRGPGPAGDRREGGFRFDGSAWNYWQGGAQKCWGKRQFPQCS